MRDPDAARTAVPGRNGSIFIIENIYDCDFWNAIGIKDFNVSRRIYESILSPADNRQNIAKTATCTKTKLSSTIVDLDMF
jgi:hypothetical protein